MTKPSLPLVALAAALATPASAQYAAAPANDADRLAAEMRVIGANPTDVVALTEAGELSTRLGDLSGAGSLFARADKVDPRNGRVKAGMAGVLLHLERPGEALQFYNQAEGYGYPVARFAADRGLAYDLVAQQGRAQRDYRLALAGGAADDETVRRYALSLGISGQKEAALHLLDPLLRRNDRAGWRARAFVLAMNGETGAAQAIATTMMAPGQASGMATFFARLPALGPADRAFAVQFGELRPTPQRLADLRLAPALPALAAEIVPVPRAAPPPVQVAVARVDKRKRGKKGAVQLAAVTPPPVAPPLPAPPAYGTRTLASGPALASRAPVPGFGAGAQPSRPPIAVAALGARTLPSAYGAAGRPDRAPATVAALAPRVLPARSPLPPPPVLAASTATPRQAVATSGPRVPVTPGQAVPTTIAAVGAPTSPPTTIRPAPVALAQAEPARTDRYVAIERPGSLLPTYVRVPSSPRAPVATGASSVVAPRLARVTGTLSPAVTTPVVSSPVVARLPSATTPVTVASSAPTSPAIQISAVPTPSRVAVAELNPSVATLAHDAGTGLTVGAVAGPRPAPSSSLAGGAEPAGAAAPVASGAPLPSAALAPPATALASGVGELSAGAATSHSGLTGPGITVASAVVAPGPAMAPPAAPATTAAPTANVPATAAAPPGGVVGPSLDTGGAPAAIMTTTGAFAGFATEVAGIDAVPAGVSSASAPGSPSAAPVASGEPAGVAVTRASPAKDGALARIIAALPVPASELNIAPTAAVPKRVGQVASPEGPAKAGGGTVQPHGVAVARHDPASAAREGSQTASTRHKASDAAESSARDHAAAGGGDSAPVAKTRARKEIARTEDAAAAPRHGSSASDTPATGKARHAALAKADEDDAAPTHRKHGRGDASDDDGKKPSRSGRKASTAAHEAEPQKYWVQVAGGANEASLGKAWQIARSKAPALAGRKGYTTPLHATNRVLAGPFKSDDEARAFVNTLNKQGVHAFQFTNDKGQKVKKLEDE